MAGILLVSNISGRQAQPSETVLPFSSSAAPAAAMPVPDTAQPGSSASPMPSSAPMQQPTLENVPAPGNATKRSFSVSFGPQQESDTQCAAPAKVKPTTDGASTPVKPDEPSGHDWCDTSVWLNHWAYPSSPTAGTTYVVEHACQHHRCPGSFMRCTSHCSDSGSKTYSVKPGAVITITTPNGILTYQVCNIGSSPKGASLQVPTCKKPISLVVYNCEYDGDVSINNVVAAATLVGARKLG